ncbi:MAG: hypothetical protein QM820_58855 [Minicystis sp.]
MSTSTIEAPGSSENRRPGRPAFAEGQEAPLPHVRVARRDDLEPPHRHRDGLDQREEGEPREDEGREREREAVVRLRAAVQRDPRGGEGPDRDDRERREVHRADGEHRSDDDHRQQDRRQPL